MSASDNLTILREYESAWEYFRRKGMKYRNFYRNRQYTKKTSRDLIKMGLKPLSVNIVRPLIGQMNSILTSTKPTWKVVPLQGASKEVAEITEKYLVGKWNSDYSDIQLDAVVNDMLVVGIGYLFVDVANFMENATFDITMERLNWKYVYPDPNSYKFDFSDAENFIVRKKISPGYAQVKFKLTESQVKQAFGDNIGVGQSTQQVDVIDRFSKYPTVHYSYTVPDKHRDYLSDKIVQEEGHTFYTSNLKGKIEQENRKWVKELRELESEGKVELKDKKELNIYRCQSVGEITRYEGIMNIRDYPIIPFTNEMSDEATKVDPETLFVEGIQEHLNKYYMLTLHNALLTGNVRILAAEGSIKNKAQFQKTWNLPGGVSEWTPDPSLPDGGKPQIIQPGQLSSAFYALSKDLQEKAEYQTSMFAPVRGDASGSPETFSTTSTLQNYGTERLKKTARRIEIQIAKAGEVMIQFLQNYSSENELLEYIDDRSFLEGGQVNTNFGMPTQIGVLNQTDVKDATLVKEFKNDSRIGKYALKVLTQPNLGTDRLIKAAFLSNMVMNHGIPSTPATMKKIYDLLEIPGAQEIVTEMMATQPNEQKMKGLIENIQVLQKQNQMLTQQSLDMAKKLEVSDFSNQLDKDLAKIKENIHSTKDEIVEKLIRDFIERGKNDGTEKTT